MTSAELAEREDFLIGASAPMYQRFLLEQVWDRVGFDVEAGKTFATTGPMMHIFRQMLFSTIVPNANKLGLFRSRIRELHQKSNVIQWAHAPDSERLGEELVG